MALTKFVRNLEDLSDDGGYKFRFRCDRCADGYDSQYESSSANLLKTAVQIFSIFTRFGYGARNAVAGLDRGLRGKERDAAYERAVHEAMAHFKKCSGCGHWVCPEHCWNQPRGMCEGCAPDAREAAIKDAAVRAAEQARGQAQLAAGPLACPSCGLQIRATAKFCEGCGGAIAALHCKHCSQAISHDARFCGHCGGALA